MDKKYLEKTEELISFISKSPSCFHACSNVADMLKDAGFVQLFEDKPYELKKGSSYFVCRNSSALMAFRIPETEPKGFSIVASHTDSPSFKLKANPEITPSDAYTILNVEGYGGMLMAPWFDRPLSMAGRAFVRKPNGDIEEKLVDFPKPTCSIVNLAIHQNRTANNGMEYKIQSDLFPILGLGSHKGSVVSMVARALGEKEEDILDSELFLYNQMKGTVWGLEDEFFSSPKIDDLQCAFSSIKALIETEASPYIQVCALFDNEEVGSGTKQGAVGDFLSQTLDRIGDSLLWDRSMQFQKQANSFMISADNGHAFHPNHPEVCDPTNKPLPNNGLMIKYAGNQKYTTDAYSGSFLKNLLLKAGIPYQVFHNNSNVPGGSTLGNLSSVQYSIPTVDIGSAQLAMHSPYETGGTKDTLYLIDAMKAFFERA